MSYMSYEELHAIRHDAALRTAVHAACPAISNRNYSQAVIKTGNGDALLDLGWYALSDADMEERVPDNIEAIEDEWEKTDLPTLPTEFDFNGKTILLQHKKAFMAHH